MKSYLSIVLLLLIAQSLCFESVEEVQKQLAWSMQLRIKAKGTFKLSHLQNQDAVKAKNVATVLQLEEEIKEMTAPEQAELKAQKQGLLDAMKLSATEKEAAEKEYEDGYNAKATDLTGEIDGQNQIIKDPEGDPVAKQEAVAALVIAQDKLKELNQEHTSKNNGKHNVTQLFMDDETTIELPIICQKKLSTNELLELGVKGESYMEKWKAATGIVAEEGRRRSIKNKKSKTMRFSKTHQDEETPPKNTFDNLAPLDQEGFSTFYASITSAIEDQDREQDALYIGEAGEEGAEDEKALVFQTACFGKDRMFLNWLEFWVYMCNNGVQPKESEYLAPANQVDVKEFEEMHPNWSSRGAAARMMKKSNKQHKRRTAAHRFLHKILQHHHIKK